MDPPYYELHLLMFSHIQNSGIISSPSRSLFNTYLAAATTTHAEESWSGPAGFWQLLTVWTGNVMINDSIHSVFFGCMNFRCICAHFVWFLNIHSLLLSQYRGMIYFSVSKCHQREQTSHSLIYNCHTPRGFIYLISLQTKESKQDSFNEIL